MHISGDVKSDYFNNNFGFGVQLRKALGYVFSLRADYTYGEARGLNWNASEFIGRNDALNGINGPDYGISGGDEEHDVPGGNAYGNVYHNYKTYYNEASIQGVITLNNINFHQERNKWNIYFGAGIGVSGYKTKINALDENDDLYNYLPITAEFAVAEIDDRHDVLVELRDLLDDSYETDAERHTDEESGFRGMTLNPLANGSIGFGYRFSNKLAMALEHRLSWTNDDLVDGQRWQEWDALTRDFDAVHYSSVRLDYHIGKQDKNVLPLWWMNPMAASYDYLSKTPIQYVPNDADGDGVIDEMDQQPDSQPNCPVDTRGVTLDSDGDGCIDCEDPEPFSTPGLPIVDCKNVQPEFNCDDCPIAEVADPCATAVRELPGIYFGSDECDLDPLYYAHLHTVAQLMQDCPDARVVLVGHTDKDRDIKYNEKLSWNRVMQTINYLVNTYGISRDRFIANYRGESEATDDKDASRRVDFRVADPGESGSSNPADPHPGLKAGDCE